MRPPRAGMCYHTCVPRLVSVEVNGFRSIKEAKLDLSPINICVGSNGAGKSNLIAFFKLLNELMGGRLQHYVATTGRAAANLYFGPKMTPQLEAKLKFEADQGTNTYHMRLFHAAGDLLVFAEESLSFQALDRDFPQHVSLGTGHQEALVREFVEGEPLLNTLRNFLNHCRVYHFHDTSPTARIHQHCFVEDNRWLMSDAGNLAAILYRMKSESNATYRRIVRNIRQVAPFFLDFDLEPAGPHKKELLLNWRHRDSDLLFGPHQLSDGTLRAMCLITLLQQPGDDLPYLVVVDEPELGLHPQALNLIASLFQAVSENLQILVSTQSSTFVDCFDPGDLIVVEREQGSTTFKRPEPAMLEAWLDEYSLGELWEKNVIGGGPH